MKNLGTPSLATSTRDLSICLLRSSKSVCMPFQSLIFMLLRIFAQDVLIASQDLQHHARKDYMSANMIINMFYDTSCCDLTARTWHRLVMHCATTLIKFRLLHVVTALVTQSASLLVHQYGPSRQCCNEVTANTCTKTHAQSRTATRTCLWQT
jgi:hypothetical protein